MIAHEFCYYRPDTLAEALTLRGEMEKTGRRAFWYAGGTEVLSMARMEAIQPDAVIDLKALPECGGVALREGRLHVGACATLSQVTESGLFPMLGQTVARIADHTNQCKITVGGNLAGTIQYREASLPLLIADAQAEITSTRGTRSVSLPSVFDGRLRLDGSELLLSLSMPGAAAKWPFVHEKLVRADKMDYPLCTVVVAKDDAGFLRLALSGLCDAPLRDQGMEAALNDPQKAVEQRVKAAMKRIPAPVLDDHVGSAAYRLFRLEGALCDAVHALEGEQNAKA